MPTQEYFERKRKYIAEYNRKHYKDINVKFKVDDADDKEIYEFLRSQSSTAAYIKKLVKADMKKRED
jgi:hypothetical protein